MADLEIVKTLKNERDQLLSQPYFSRKQEKLLTNVISSRLIKVVIGPRRAGKSTLAINSLSKFKDFFYINFDSQQLIDLQDKFKFITENSTKFKNGKILFLDEIQNVDRFELLVNQLQRNGFNVIISGSNANLLSRELSTHLTGRYTSIEVLPLSFEEAKSIHKKITFLDFMFFGGYPEQVISNGIVSAYVETLFKSIILKDIVSRYSLRNVGDLNRLSDYLINNPSQVSNYTKLKNKLDLASTNTVIDYYHYLAESYLISPLKYFYFKNSQVSRSDFKSYLIDTGIFANNKNRFEINKGYLFENAIFLELLKKGYKPNVDLFMLKDSDSKEIDFFVKSDNNLYIQSCLSVLDNTTREREFISLKNAGKGSKIVVVMDSSEEILSNDDIEVVSVEKFLKSLG